MKLHASVHRDEAEELLELAKGFNTDVMEARDNIDSVVELRAEKDRDYCIARALVHAVLAKGWN